MLLTVGLLGGWPFAIFAQQLHIPKLDLYRHKSTKQPFQTKFILYTVANIILTPFIDEILID